MECFKCGVSSEKTQLRDVISNEGIVKICRMCSIEESLPFVRDQAENNEKEFGTRKTVQDRLESISGVKLKKIVPRNIVLDNQEFGLRKIVDRNFAERVPKTRGNRDDMVRNFHWVIMRARRSKKLSQKQLADAIVEPEKVVRSAELGILHETDYTLVKKLEGYLGIKILTKEVDEKKSVISVNKLELTKNSSKVLTIADLNEIKRREIKEKLEQKHKLEDEDGIDIHEEYVEEIDDDIDFEEKD